MVIKLSFLERQGFHVLGRERDKNTEDRRRRAETGRKRRAGENGVGESDEEVT